MLLSMTGFGKSIAENKNLSVEIELKSVNNRFLEINFRMPFYLNDKESILRDIITSKIKRGKLNISLIVNFKNKVNSPWGINKDKLENYLDEINEIKKLGNINDEIKLNHILLNKELFTGNKIELSDSDLNLIKDALNKAVNEILTMKINEGNELAKDLSDRINNIENEIVEIEKKAIESVDDSYRLLNERISKLTKDLELNKERLELEVAIIADKADITEECVRLKSHLKFFTECINSKDSNGKRLNFLCQEINREANTIASKTLSGDISHKSIFIKEEVEKIREQIQNIE